MPGRIDQVIQNPCRQCILDYLVTFVEEAFGDLQASLYRDYVIRAKSWLEDTPPKAFRDNSEGQHGTFARSLFNQCANRLRCGREPLDQKRRQLTERDHNHTTT